MDIQTPHGITLRLLSEKAIYVPEQGALLLADLHLGKSETFQRFGVPVPNAVNEGTLKRLQRLWGEVRSHHIFILGDLLHSQQAMVASVLQTWEQFRQTVEAEVTLIVGNHDRPLQRELDRLQIRWVAEPIHLPGLVLSHDPLEPAAVGTENFQICGHIHPCVRLQTRLDSLRLPCFYQEHRLNRLTLPSFGEFTGGYEVALTEGVTAYAVAEGRVIPFEGSARPRRRSR